MKIKTSEKRYTFLKNKNRMRYFLSTSLFIFLFMLFDSSQVKLFGNEQISSNNKPEIIESTVDIEEENMEDGSASYLAEAGKFEIGDDPTVWILIILFNLAVAVAIERTIYLYKNRGNNSELVDILTTKLSERCNDCRELVEKVRDKIYGMEGRIAAKTLQGWNYGRETMNEFSKAAIESEKRLLDKRLIVLSTLGNNAPFIGLLGTVLGIMKA
ncbi:MAG: MotA/TolQ/ExbB proton channel family protein, partial [Spirochaetota bacterium]|nr:MotA/TolQ/ExbB proton channel family protein [Spirochaetota bacterium]